MPTKVLWMRRQRVLSLGIPRDFNRLGAEEKPDFSGYFFTDLIERSMMING
jgi:hypothetical protein